MMSGGFALALGQAGAAQAQSGPTDADVLNFALNLEYLEAQFYYFASYGEALPNSILGGSGTAGAATGGRRVAFTDPAVQAYARWLPLINYENRQGGILTAKALMKEGGVIACEAARHPFPAMNPDVRAGLLETARRLDPMVLRWGR